MKCMYVRLQGFYADIIIVIVGNRREREMGKCALLQAGHQRHSAEKILSLSASRSLTSVDTD